MQATTTRVRPLILAAGALAILSAAPATAQPTKQFTFSQAANDRLAKKMNLPPYFALPESARGDVPANVPTTDVLVDWRHPDPRAKDLGLRLIVTKRAGMSQRLARSGLIQTGDLLLTFRPEWGGGGPYPNIQMGISHTGIAYLQNGEVRNIDNPLTDEYHGRNMRSNLTGPNFDELNYLHIVRPRGLDDAQRKNLVAWFDRFRTNARQIYPGKLDFNQDYNAPKFQEGKPLDFVKRIGQIGLGQPGSGPTLGMFCSEFAWSLLALRKCDPATTAQSFAGGGIPSCIDPIMTPMNAVGSFAYRQTRGASAGLADGPLLIIDAMKLPRPERLKMVNAVFTENPASLGKMSIGHRTVAKDMQPKFAPLRRYYEGATGNLVQRMSAGTLAATFTRDIPDNYSPTSYLINTLLPKDNTNRTMDYIATIVIE